MIAMALACGSKLLFADEPTTAVDVSVQLRILRLSQDVMQKTGMSVILISHDMGVIGSMCDRVHVMYAGQIVEYGPTQEVIQKPAHPYVVSLINAIPRFEGSDRRLRHIRGEVCDPLSPPSGCRFHPRCPSARPECSEVDPIMVPVGGSSWRCLPRLERGVHGTPEGRRETRSWDGVAFGETRVMESGKLAGRRRPDEGGQAKVLFVVSFLASYSGRHQRRLGDWGAYGVIGIPRAEGRIANTARDRGKSGRLLVHRWPCAGRRNAAGERIASVPSRPEPLNS